MEKPCVWQDRCRTRCPINTEMVFFLCKTHPHPHSLHYRHPEIRTTGSGQASEWRNENLWSNENSFPPIKTLESALEAQRSQASMKLYQWDVCFHTGCTVHRKQSELNEPSVRYLITNSVKYSISSKVTNNIQQIDIHQHFIAAF